MRIFLTLTFLSFFIFSVAQENVLTQLLKENNKQFGGVLDRPDQYDVQIIYTQINRDENNYLPSNLLITIWTKKNIIIQQVPLKWPWPFWHWKK